MSLMFLLLVQSGIDWSAEADRKLLDLDTAATRARKCAAGESGEIVVCARDAGERYRLPELPSVEEPVGLPRAEVEIAEGVNSSIALSEATMPDGTVSKRVMFNLKLGF